jgi:septal ring factor EnvC (AmiA/AmiB activator)
MGDGTTRDTGRAQHHPAGRRWLALIGLALVAFHGPLHAQQPDIQQSRKRLDEIRDERSKLQQQQARLQGQVSDVGAALRNIEKQRDATNRLVNEIESEMSGLTSQLDRSAAEYIEAQDRLIDAKAVLRRRLADIYRRGPLYTFQVLLAAESFGDLLTRYKYLYLTSRQDRALVAEVTTLTDSVEQQRGRLLGVRSQLDERKQEREDEIDNYSRLADERQSQLRELQRTTRQTSQKLTALQKDEASVSDFISSLERARRAAEADRAARPETVNTPSAAHGMSTSDIGKLDWPVDGDLDIRFGPDTMADGGVIRWNGIGIKAAVGTPVKAVAPGKVVRVQRLSTYGLGVVLQHGNGYYSLYWQLQSATVKEGQQIARGQTVGTVGGQNTATGSHLYFEIRGEDGIALDPVAWLKARK